MIRLLRRHDPQHPHTHDDRREGGFDEGKGTPISGSFDLRIPNLVPGLGYFTRVESLKMGRMIAIAMNPTIDPMMIIMMGSINDVTVLIASRNCLA